MDINSSLMLGVVLLLKISVVLSKLIHYPEASPYSSSNFCKFLVVTASALQKIIFSYQRTFGGTKPFRFEAMWVGTEGCKQIIQENWINRGSNASMASVLNSLLCCWENLKQWTKSSFGHVQGNLRRAEASLKLKQNMNPSNHS